MRSERGQSRYANSSMLQSGDKVNQRYAINRVMSSGLLSNVYEGQDTAIQRRVVLKELVGGKSRPSTARIQREVELYARLRHPNILELLDVIITEGTVYLIFPFIEGATLADAIRRGKVSTAQALFLASGIAEAIAYIHEQNVIHRDIKPANILLDRGRAILADFGIAKDIADEAGLALTRDGETLGTPLYMAPEALRNESIGRPADVYALGVVLFEMFAGVLPFTGRNFAELVANRLKSGPPALTQFRAGISPAVTELVQRMLSNDSAMRPTAAQVCEVLAAVSASPFADAPDLPSMKTARAPVGGLGSSLAATMEGDVRIPPIVASPEPPSIKDVFSPAAPSIPDSLSRTIGVGLEKTVVVRGRSLAETLHDLPTEESRGFFQDELARQDELNRSRAFYRTQLSEDYDNLMFQARMSFWLWVLFSFVGFVVFIVGIVLLYAGRWQEGSATMVSETIVVFIQKLFKDREDEFRERAAKKNRHVELGNLWNLAAQSLDGLDAVTRREKLSKLTDALIHQVGGG